MHHPIFCRAALPTHTLQLLCASNNFLQSLSPLTLFCGSMNLAYCWGSWPQDQLRNHWSAIYPSRSQGSINKWLCFPKIRSNWALNEDWARGGEKQDTPCTHSLHKNECILLFPFCTEVNEGVDSDCNIGISKLRMITWFPVLLASSTDAARQFWQLLKDRTKTVLVWRLCCDLIVH